MKELLHPSLWREAILLIMFYIACFRLYELLLANQPFTFTLHLEDDNTARLGLQEPVQDRNGEFREDSHLIHEEDKEDEECIFGEDEDCIEEDEECEYQQKCEISTSSIAPNIV